jgi:hypothetical protein
MTHDRAREILRHHLTQGPTPVEEAMCTLLVGEPSRRAISIEDEELARLTNIAWAAWNAGYAPVMTNVVRDLWAEFQKGTK